MKNREIKIKFWDVTHKNMSKPMELNECINLIADAKYFLGKAEGFLGNKTDNSKLFNEVRIPILCTDWKDLNGDEVYEGHILRGNLPYEKSSEYPIVKIIWDSAKGGFELKSMNSIINPPINWISVYEIIGHIYDPPIEILKKNKCDGY